MLQRTSARGEVERFLEALPADAACLGAHVEGPYLNPEAAGAQAPEHIRPVDQAELEGWLATGSVRMVTLAPEVEGAFEAIERIVAADAIAAIGHTATNHRTARTAVDVVTLPVKAVGAGVDAVTTSQAEADQRRGREIREEEERLGRLARRCERNPDRDKPSSFPKKLSDSGLFKSVKGHVVEPSLIPYSVNAVLWSDGAAKMRWLGIPEGGMIDFTTNRGLPFNVDAMARFAQAGIARVLLMKLDRRAIAFQYYLVFERRMFFYRLAFDPDFARWSPGLLTTLAAIEAAAAEGVERVEFLGGDERYKQELADTNDPLYECVGFASSLRGRAAATASVLALGARIHFKGSGLARRIESGTVALRRGRRPTSD